MGLIVSHAECGNCARPVKDGARICATCTNGLRRELRCVPDLVEDLLTAMSRQDKLTAGGGPRGKGAEQPLPVRLDITPALRALSKELRGWAADLVERHGLDVPDPSDRGEQGLLCYAATWLADHMDLFRVHPGAITAYNRINTAITRARTKVDSQTDRTRFVVGPCPETDHHGHPCPGEVWAHVPTDQRWPAELRCRTCNTSWDTTRWQPTATRIAARRQELDRTTP